MVAYCNATSSAALAAVYPTSGGTYVYGRERLGEFWGYLAGWGFVVGKTASCAAMALTVGAYAYPQWQRPIAAAAVLVLTAVNFHGVRKTAALTRVIVAIVLASLAAVIVGALAGGQATSQNLGDLGVGGVRGVLQSAGLLFFAFAGYARIATLGEEVRDPARTIPKAIPRALGDHPRRLRRRRHRRAPRRRTRGARPLGGTAHDCRARPAPSTGSSPAVRIGGTIAALGVLLSLIAGVSRTMFAMAADGELPRWLDAVHPDHKVPHRAEVTVGCLVAALVLLTDLRGAIGFSSFCRAHLLRDRQRLSVDAATPAATLAACARRRRGRRMRTARPDAAGLEHRRRQRRARRRRPRVVRPAPSLRSELAGPGRLKAVEGSPGRSGARCGASSGRSAAACSIDRPGTSRLRTS